MSGRPSAPLPQGSVGTEFLLEAPQDFQSSERRLLSERSDSTVEFSKKPFLGTPAPKAGPPPFLCSHNLAAGFQVETSPLLSRSRAPFQTTVQAS